MEPTLAIQIAARGLLIASPAVTALVPANRIVDLHPRIDQFPAISIGTAFTVAERITFGRPLVRATLDVHVWTKETGLETVKTIGGAARAALAERPAIMGLQVVDWLVSGTRFLRDPGDVGHGVLTVEALVRELVQ